MITSEITNNCKSSDLPKYIRNMFKHVLVFGLMVASAGAKDTSHFKLSRHTELSKPSNQTNQTIQQSFGKPTPDSLQTQQKKRLSHDPKTQPGKDPFTWFMKWSPTNYSCPPVNQMTAPFKNEDLAMRMSVSMRKEDSNQNKLEKKVEVETSHPKEKREARIPRKEFSLLDDWIEDKVKVSHISHIYIGESLYPYIYEESRVFKSEPPNPSSGENPLLKEVKITETRHKQEEEAPVYEITKIYEIK